jgi:hypothetical protein
MVLQCPGDGAEAQAASRNSSSVISPAASLQRLRQMTVPEPTLISRLTLRFAFRQIALRMDAQKRLSLANNSDLA